MKRIVLSLSLFFIVSFLFASNVTTFNNVILIKKTVQVGNDDGNLKFKLPEYNPKLFLFNKTSNMDVCSASGIFSSCSISCPGGCSCTASGFSCSCACDNRGAKMVSIDREQYKNLEKLVDVLNINPDEKTQIAFNDLLKMINSLEKRNYESYNLAANKFTNDLKKLNKIQKNNLNKFFKSLGFEFRV